MQMLFGFHFVNQMRAQSVRIFETRRIINCTLMIMRRARGKYFI